ncbi:Gastric triacylglycerol lipase [Phytophthora nicotianae]|uniref:Extracellular signal-regulated kinase 1 n=1 Tax=Phytophthora nicotianae TaxID=4792 RepID=A0A0W8CBV6_PHYNI|nr:Gastric triacylglycerol lipase [Phytophthora nicotianae]KUF81540.1 Gastric triacylglycerol lipase [Phytophthora nicotianae]KUF98740.1 Extracellular signal-regulated kinase 1 [Phytophthora nicotianae]
MVLSRYSLLKLFILSILLLVMGTVDVVGKAAVAEVDIDDDVGRNVVEIVQARGYFVETHKVVTADDYVLTMYRLPKTYEESQAGAEPTAAKPVALLQHGLLDSSFTFVNNFRNQSLAFVLADAGYDVWLGNNRGTTWSREHLTYTEDDDEFWEFSWEDMGKYDLPAEIEYALNKSESTTLSFVGHSEGTTQAFVGFSLDQQLARKVSYFAALAPVAWTGHLTAKIFKGMADVHLDKVFQAFGISEFSAKSKFLQEMLAGFACTVADELCDSAIALVAGPSVSTNTSRLPVYISQTPAGTSVKNMAHYAQNIRDDTFAPYDYGCKCKRDFGIDKCSENKCENKKVYGSFDPPAFPIEKMVFPRTGLFIGSADTIATATDIEKLRDALPSGTIVHELAVKEYSHLDLVWAYNANEKIYEDLLAQLEEHQGVGYTTIPEPTDSGSVGSLTDDVIESRTSLSFRQLD